MRGDLKKAILESLVELALAPIEIFIAINGAGYGASRGKIERELEKVQSWRNTPADVFKNKRSLYNTLQKLKKDGLIEHNKGKWLATLLGKAGLKKIKDGPKRTRYETEKSDELMIVIFDVPERLKNKREWLRSALRNMGFKMVQKSVWSGKIKIPRSFLADLKDLGLLDHIDIFRATKLGSLA